MLWNSVLHGQLSVCLLGLLEFICKINDPAPLNTMSSSSRRYKPS